MSKRADNPGGPGLTCLYKGEEVGYFLGKEVPKLLKDGWFDNPTAAEAKAKPEAEAKAA